MRAWILPQPILLGAVAAVATTVAYLHARSVSSSSDWQRLEEALEPEQDEPRPKRARISYPRTDKWESTWGKVLTHIRSARAAGRPDAHAEDKFKSRFRLPFDLFEQILSEIRGRDGYVASNDLDSHLPKCGRASIPVDIMFMAVLRIAGRGWCFDDVEEASGIGLSTVAGYYHTFVRQYVDDWYDEWVYLPSTPEQIEEVTSVYEVQGLPGCVGSVDVVHLWWGRCEWALRHMHIGKEGFPTRAYEVVADGVKRIRSVTPGFPGALNDKTIVRHDHAVNLIKGTPAMPAIPGVRGAISAIPGIYDGVAFKLRDIGGVIQTCASNLNPRP
jgi:hypothetical protein